MSANFYVVQISQGSAMYNFLSVQYDMFVWSVFRWSQSSIQREIRGTHSSTTSTSVCSCFKICRRATPSWSPLTSLAAWTPKTVLLWVLLLLHLWYIQWSGSWAIWRDCLNWLDVVLIIHLKHFKTKFSNEAIIVLVFLPSLPGELRRWRRNRLLGFWKETASSKSHLHHRHPRHPRRTHVTRASLPSSRHQPLFLHLAPALTAAARLHKPPTTSQHNQVGEESVRQSQNSR